MKFENFLDACITMSIGIILAHLVAHLDWNASLGVALGVELISMIPEKKKRVSV